MLLLTGSIFGVLIGGGILLLRGAPPGGRRPRFSTGLLLWALVFTVTGAVALIHSLTSDVIGPDGELGGIIVGATFLVMGLPVLFYVVARAFGDRPTGRTGFSMPSPSAVRSMAGSFTAPRTGGDRITKLERLDRLRESGALSRAEFEREKARILSG